MNNISNKVTLRKIIFLIIALILAYLGGSKFWEMRHYKEKVVVSEDFTERVMLSKYFDGIEGTWLDTPVYVYDSGNPGGSMLLLGGTHPYEPATMLTAFVAMENMSIDKGKVFIIPNANRSAVTMGDYGEGYPSYFHVDTPWGQKKMRIGARSTNPLDQWPDPYAYVHYPSGQNLAYQDIRNLNRTYPGRPDGTPTEQLAYSILELIRQEDIDLYFDTHEASLMYPVVSTFVAHQDALDMALMASMSLTSTQFNMKCEASPKNLRGLSHREVGDYTDALAILTETAEPFIDRVAGKRTPELMMTGKDEFLQTASEHDLLYTDYDIEFGKPMKYRVGRHLSSVLEIINQMNFSFPDKEIQLDFPDYNDLMENGTGYYLHNPAEADPDRVFEN